MVIAHPQSCDVVILFSRRVVGWAVGDRLHRALALAALRKALVMRRPPKGLTSDTVELAWVDQGYTGERAATAAARHGITLEVVKLPQARRGFILLPRRWVVERSLAWVTRFRRLVKYYERYAETLAGLHVVAFACLMMKQAAAIAASP